MGDEEDWQLFRAWRAGDAAGGERLVERYLGPLTRFFRNKVRSREDAADLISETLLACTRGKEQMRNDEAFRSFVFAAAMNQLRHYYRKQAKRERELDDFADVCVDEATGPGSPSVLISQQEEVQLLVRALRRLPLDYQIVLELGYFESLAGTEIAELLGVPLPTVYTRMRRGKDKLRLVMGELAQSAAMVESTMMGLRTWATRIRAEMAR